MFLLVSTTTSSLCKNQYLTYIQATISDLVQIRPEDFSKFSAVAIEDNINEKYANKVSIESSFTWQGPNKLLLAGHSKNRSMHRIL